MFFLSFTDTILPAALLGMLFTLLLLAALVVFLQLYGFRFLRRKKRRAKIERPYVAQKSDELPDSSDPTEEELVVILTAAAMQALGTEDLSRFRVVAFRRV